MGLKIIDFEKKGNMVKFYLGSSDCKTYWGDDWDDRPYEHNAGKVYDEFIAGYIVKAFDFDAIVMEPCDGEFNSPWCKDDMKARKVPCICVLPKKYQSEYTWYSRFTEISNDANTIKFFFGDEIDEEKEDVTYLKDLKGDDYYIQVATKYDSKLLRAAVSMFGESLKYAANDKYLSEKDDTTLNNLILLTAEQAKDYLVTLIREANKIYKMENNVCDVIDDLDVVLKNGRQCINRDKFRYNICYMSNDNFKIGSMDILPAGR